MASKKKSKIMAKKKNIQKPKKKASKDIPLSTAEKEIVSTIETLTSSQGRVPNNQELCKVLPMKAATVVKMRRDLVKRGIVEAAPAGKPKGYKHAKKREPKKGVPFFNAVDVLHEAGVPGHLNIDGVKVYLKEAIKNLDAQRKKLSKALKVLGG